ncbi:hypothetical protein Hypma_000293 [Hypsizygus marmoreus]|uniref:Phosphatidylglycerol/phosphatidylinositol transfer protein n=1 Tax=Hypsizygus marmoreus TaxID=39966 RepID=A0A369JAV7_HYPMA|nr:hypothetical protein Hypma_000293 [Hypsizygus marmoreus]
MKLSSMLALATLLGVTASAQRVAIGYPADGAHVKAGSSLTVEVDRPEFLSSAQEVAIVIGLQSCPTFQCLPPSLTMGNVLLYNGAYKPEWHSDAPPSKPPHQNFSVVIPQDTQKGKAQLGVTHVSLVGASLGPFLETLNITLTVV